MTRIPLWIEPPTLDEAFLAAADACHCPVIGRDLHRDADAIVDADQVLAARIVSAQGASGQEEAAAMEGRIIVDAADWTIIPLENLIAARRDRPDSLYAVATTAEQAGVFRDTLDVGVHGVVLRPKTPQDIHDAHAILTAKGPRPDDRPDAEADIALTPATITAFRDAGPGDRVCIDTTQDLAPGEGVLVGSTARGFALVHAETLSSDYVAARPFRINAGAVHQYVLVPGGKTRYLSELRAGDDILVAGPDGVRAVPIGRVKIERRPHFLITWPGGHVIVQNAETIRLVTPQGIARSVTDLRPGDDILVHHETAARHFGMAVDERLVER